MTRKEAIKIIEIIDLRYMTLDTKERQALRMAIKALEQEPILDKIRAEIEQTRKMYLDMNDIDWLNGCDYVLSVIDKYNAESEEEE